MNCNCCSKNLYHNYDNLSCKVDGKTISQSRIFTKHHPSHPAAEILKQIFQTSQIYLPTHIQKIDVQQLYANPLWFYKNYISKNKPCIINNCIETDIVDVWSNPKQFIEITKDIGDISVSVTPDGFADSIKGEYFVEPLEIQGSIADVIDWGNQGGEKEKGKKIRDDWIPYVQHQNSNLTQQCQGLVKYLDEEFKDFASLHLFDNNQPDASNFWMGYSNSVSSIHKDPYQNFYTTIVGQKHFTLLPPVSIAYLQQHTYKSSKYILNSQTNQLQISTNPNKSKHKQNQIKQQNKQYNENENEEYEKELPYENTRWISCNPDLIDDFTLFPELQILKPYQHHVILEAGQTLYLPSLWYHQVGQTHQQSYATIAINYWFDMEFGHSYSLYQAARKLKGYP